MAAWMGLAYLSDEEQGQEPGLSAPPVPGVCVSEELRASGECRGEDGLATQRNRDPFE